MKSIVDKVIEFKQAVLGIEPGLVVAELSSPNFELLLRQLDEELLELQAGWEDSSVVNQIDALVDLAYYALGGLYLYGLTAPKIEHVFGLVHDANMTKGVGKVAKRHVEGALDAVKPVDFVTPELAIREYLNV